MVLMRDSNHHALVLFACRDLSLETTARGFAASISLDETIYPKGLISRRDKKKPQRAKYTRFLAFSTQHRVAFFYRQIFVLGLRHAESGNPARCPVGPVGPATMTSAKPSHRRLHRRSPPHTLLRIPTFTPDGFYGGYKALR
jgi:hypothetical protein